MDTKTEEKVGQICGLIERYFDKLQSSGMELYGEAIPPQSPEALASLEAELGVTLPADVRAFLSRGLEAKTGSIEEGDAFASLGFEFLDASQIVEHTQMLREIAEDPDEDDGHASVILNGFAITYEEPELVVTPEGVYHFSFRNPLLHVADSFEQFLEHWLASGCFGSHDFAALWSRVEEHVPVRIPPSENLWVQAYRRQFPDE